jgi:hypothetical protein
MDPRATDWTSELVMQADMPELSTWRFVSTPDEAGNQAKMELAVNATVSRGTLVLSHPVYRTYFIAECLCPSAYIVISRLVCCLCPLKFFGR